MSSSSELGLLPPPLVGEGWGGGHIRMNLDVCPLPAPPPQAGEGTMRHPFFATRIMMDKGRAKPINKHSGDSDGFR
jgi:hypothetical protein